MCSRRSATVPRSRLLRAVPRGSRKRLFSSLLSKSRPNASAFRQSVAENAPINHEEYRRLCDFLYRRTGLIFNESRRYFVDRRIADRMAATGMASFTSYFVLLRSDHDREVEHFINAFTVNETYFYREDYQLN